MSLRRLELLFETRFLSIILSIIFLGGLSGCGFHLRGLQEVPKWLSTVSISVPQGHHDLYQRLSEQIKRQDNAVYSNPAHAKYWLIIEQDEFQQAISSISSSTTPRQYQLIYRVTFKLQRANAEEIIPSSLIEISRQLTLNSDRLLGSNHEEDQIRHDMRQEAALRIINRLSTVHEG